MHKVKFCNINITILEAPTRHSGMSVRWTPLHTPAWVSTLLNITLITQALHIGYIYCAFRFIVFGLKVGPSYRSGTSIYRMTVVNQSNYILVSKDTGHLQQSWIIIPFYFIDIRFILRRHWQLSNTYILFILPHTTLAARSSNPWSHTTYVVPSCTTSTVPWKLVGTIECISLNRVVVIPDMLVENDFSLVT